MSHRLSILAIAVIAAAAPSIAKTPGRPLFASLRGGLEVPGPGKLDARGSAVVRVTPGRSRVCYTVSYRNIPAATMAHIHSGAAGVAGPPVLTLRAPNNGVSEGCAPVPRDLARSLIDHPQRFYVNVHSQAFPNGAIRGQLHR